MQNGDRLIHMPTNTTGTFVWEAPTGHVMFTDDKGNDHLAQPQSCEAWNEDKATMIADFVDWVPTLIQMVCQLECRCGGDEEPDKVLFKCSSCMASRLLEHYYPLAPAVLVEEAAKHAQSHFPFGDLPDLKAAVGKINDVFARAMGVNNSGNPN